ncbi:MAG: DUF362 domain-containing protein, partial [Chloroflexota bacterium]
MRRSRVALVRCSTYDPNDVYEALRRGVTMLGGADRFVSPGERILLKPNVLAGETPERAVTTHPSVLSGCVRWLRECGAEVRFGDSPILDSPARGVRRSGLLEAGIRSGAQFVEFSAGGSLPNPHGESVSSFPVARAVLACDGMINLPKMKAHQLTRITGAVKNTFGCIPGRRKALYHVQFLDVFDFSQLLVDLSSLLRPRLHILDGVVAMEGNGPRGGDPRPMHLLVLSEDPVAVDATFSRLVGLDPEFVPTTVIGQQRGLGRFRRGAIEYVGEPLESFIDEGFKVVRNPVLPHAAIAHCSTIKNAVLPRPVIDARRCVCCGTCIEACPVPDKALRFTQDGSHPPQYD